MDILTLGSALALSSGSGGIPSIDTDDIEEAAAAAVTAVQNEGTTQIAAVNSAGTTQVAAVGTAKTSALSDITSAKNNAATAVSNEGGGQVTRVTNAGTAAVGDVNDAKSAALTAISTDKSTALGAISSDKTTALGAISDAKTTALSDLSSAKTTALGDISSAKTTATGDISAAGTAAVGSITAAEATTIDNIQLASADVQLDMQAKLAETLADIPEDYTTLGQQVADLNGLIKPINLFHKETATKYAWINTNTGEPISSSSKFASDYIPVKPGHTYRFYINPYTDSSKYTGNWGIYKYTADKTFIARVSGFIHTADENEYFIRVAESMSVLDYLMLFEDVYPATFYVDEHLRQVKPVTLLPDSIKNVVFKNSTNLFDSNNILRGSYFATTDRNLYVSTTKYSSAIIPVEPNTTYYIGPFAVECIHFYDSSGAITSSLTNKLGSFTTPSTAASMRFCQTYEATGNAIDRMFLVKGDEMVRHEDYDLYGVNSRKYNRIYSLSDAVWHWANNEKFPIGFLGDSTTDGAGCTGWTYDNGHAQADTDAGGVGVADYVNQLAYPYLLEQLIKEELGVTNARVYNIGYSDTQYNGRIPELEAMFSGAYADVKMVGLALGINDRCNATDYYSVYQIFRNNVIYTINWLRERGIQPFFVTPQALIAPYTMTTFPTLNARTAEHLQTIIIRVMYELAEEFNMEVLDMNDIGAYAMKHSSSAASAICPDRLHFSDLGNVLEARSLFCQIVKRYKTMTGSGLLTFVDQDIKSRVWEDMLTYTNDAWGAKVYYTNDTSDDTLLMDFWIDNRSGGPMLLQSYCTTAGAQYVTVDGTQTNITVADGQNIATLDVGPHHIVAMTGETTAWDWIGFQLTALTDDDVGYPVVAPVEHGFASQNYSKYSYLCWNNKLYEVTTYIPSGTALVVGTNVVETSVNHDLSPSAMTQYYRLVRLGDVAEKIFTDKQYEVGQYVSAGQFLYTATQQISQFSHVVPGTNCSSVEVADALNDMEAATVAEVKTYLGIS